MTSYVLKKLLLAIPVFVGVTFAVFLIAQVTPGDPALIMLGERAPAEDLARLREALGLNDPWYEQYWRYLTGVVRGDFGMSYRSQRPVFEEVTARFPATAELAATAMLVAICAAVPLGVLSATRQNSWIDQLAMAFAMFGNSMPVFWSGLLLQLAFALRLGLFPATGRSDWSSYILPACALGFSAAALIARLTRSSMLEVLRQDYVRTARAKGLVERNVVYRHALKNALIPVITVVGLQFGGLLAGAVLTETVFAWPGIGRLVVQSIGQRDFPVIRGGVLLVASTFVAINIVTDLVYVYLDPRIKYA